MTFLWFAASQICYRRFDVPKTPKYDSALTVELAGSPFWLANLAATSVRHVGFDKNYEKQVHENKWAGKWKTNEVSAKAFLSSWGKKPNGLCTYVLSLYEENGDEVTVSAVSMEQPPLF